MKFSEWKLMKETRRNPEKNPKISAYEYLEKYFGKGYYISFTEIDKLGINPKSRYNTPLGIYSYPLDEIKDFQKDSYGYSTWKDDGVEVPFAGNNPYIWVFKPKHPERVLELSDYDSEKWDDDIKKIYKFGKKYKVDKDTINEFIHESYDEAYVKNIGGYFWYITMSLSEYIETINRNVFISPKSKRNKIVIWNELFRYLGYDGISDKKGQGIIHEMEPVQAVFFSKYVIKVYEKILNKNYKTGYVNIDEKLSLSMRKIDGFRFIMMYINIKAKANAKIYNLKLHLNKILGLNESENIESAENIEKIIKKIYNLTVYDFNKYELEDVEINFDIDVDNISLYISKTMDLQYLRIIEDISNYFLLKYKFKKIIEKIKENYIKNKFNISKEDYEKFLKEFDGK